MVDLVQVNDQAINRWRLDGDQVRKTPSWPRGWANFSPLYLYAHRNAGPTCIVWANLTPCLLQTIDYLLDPTTPAAYVAPLRRGVESWNQAYQVLPGKILALERWPPDSIENLVEASQAALRVESPIAPAARRRASSGRWCAAWPPATTTSRRTTRAGALCSRSITMIVPTFLHAHVVQ